MTVNELISRGGRLSGREQLLIIAFAVILVAIAVAAGASQFDAHSIRANKDGVTSSLVGIASNAYQYRLRPKMMSGGGNSYAGYVIPSSLRNDEYGEYAVVLRTRAAMRIDGVSKMDPAWVAMCAVDESGRTLLSYNGW